MIKLHNFIPVVNEKGDVTSCGIVSTFSDFEVVALFITAESFSIDLKIISSTD